ncbi:histone deacetylase family protein [Halothiobacillus sp. DCM-1]|uniref:histone deacetylase family protein n=1 Tax=Halothiobacillus sp. DCM-1 TaxID=3112558 RepID=UPI00324F7044
MNLAYLTHPSCLNHSNGRIYGVPHPENARRLTAIQDHLIAQGFDDWLLHLTPTAATRAQLALAHDPRYLDEVWRQAPSEGGIEFAPDVVVTPQTLEAALYAAGSGITAVDWVLGASGRRAFCAIRPPGHHAGRRQAAGFCLFNNVAVAAYHALTQHGIQRLAIVDFDVHHGDGTEDIVAGDDRILFCSSFQHPFYPHTGTPPKADNCLPVPLPVGTRGTQWRTAVQTAWFRRLADFAPELILISAGFDGHREDDMSGWALQEADYAWLTEALVHQANASAHGRIVSLLEGGYAPDALARSVYAHLQALWA